MEGTHEQHHDSSTASTATHPQAQSQENGDLRTVSLSRLQQVRAMPRETKLVALPEPMRGEAMRIRRGTVREREKWEKDNTQYKNGRPRMSQEYVRAGLLIRACVNDDGTQMFSDSKEHREFINDLPANVVEYVFDEVIEYWGISRKDADEIVGGN